MAEARFLMAEHCRAVRQRASLNKAVGRNKNAIHNFESFVKFFTASHAMLKGSERIVNLDWFQNEIVMFLLVKLKIDTISPQIFMKYYTCKNMIHAHIYEGFVSCCYYYCPYFYNTERAECIKLQKCNYVFCPFCPFLAKVKHNF